MPMIFSQMIMQCSRKSQSNTVTKWILAILVSMAFGGFLSRGPSWPCLIFISFYMQTQVLSLAAPSITFALCITTWCAMHLVCQEIFSIAFSTTRRVFTGQHIRTKPRPKQDPDRKYTYLYKAGKVRSPHIAGILLKLKLSKVRKKVGWKLFTLLVLKLLF